MRDPWSRERGVDRHAPLSVAPPGAATVTRVVAPVDPRPTRIEWALAAACVLVHGWNVLYAFAALTELAR